jgi:hypothetical protein
MNLNHGAEAVRDRFVGELTDAALEAAARYGVQGPSVEQELELWEALGRVVQEQGEQPRGPECEQLLGELTEAAYEVALGHGFRGSFAEVELGLWRALRRAFAKVRTARRPRAEGRGLPWECAEPALA